ncbi:hypothetical protein ACFQX6_02705 [Streptosporangium lutulentum]
MIALAHETHHHGGGDPRALLPLAVLAVVLGGYGLLAALRGREARGGAGGGRRASPPAPSWSWAR